MEKETYLDKFRRLALLEYVSVDNVLGEDGEEPPQDAQPTGDPSQMPPQDGADGGMDPTAGGDTQAAGPQGFAPQTMGNDPSMGGMPGGDMGNGMDMTAPQGQDMGAAPEEDVEEIDVDDLVDSQEETEKKVSKLMHKFSGVADQMMSAVDALSSKIDASTEKLNKLEAEFQKRNPTPIEKLSMRTVGSYPFGQTVDQYWADKEQTSNYSPASDNDGVDNPEYTITKNDIDNISDYQNIAREMNSKKFGLSQLLNL